MGFRSSSVTMSERSQSVAVNASARSAGIATMPMASTPSASVMIPAIVGAARRVNERCTAASLVAPAASSS
jgi:hypothetical protein